MAKATHKQRSHCNKVGHPTEQAAKAAAAMLAKKKNVVTFLRAYKCQFCPRWHVGSMKGSINWDAIAAHDAQLEKLRRGHK